MSQLRIVLVGSGISALSAASRLQRGPAASQVVWVTPGGLAKISPLVPSIVSAAASVHRVAVPAATTLPRLQTIDARAVSVDMATKTIRLQGPGVRVGSDPSELSFDRLLLATGRAPRYAHVTGAQQHAITASNLNDAVMLRIRLGQALRAAGGELSARRRRALLTIAVVGGDQRVCSLALSILDALRAGRAAYPRVTHEDLRVLLLVPSDATAPFAQLGFDGALRKAGVEIIDGVDISEVGVDHLLMRREDGTDRYEEVRTVVWEDRREVPGFLRDVAGVSTREGALVVDPSGRVTGTTGLWACGDGAVTAAPGRSFSGLRWGVHSAHVAAGDISKLQANLPGFHRGPRWDGAFLSLSHGCVMTSSRRFQGALAAAILRGWLVASLPTWSSRAGVCQAAWLLKPTGPILPQRTDAPPLHLTAPPPDVG